MRPIFFLSAALLLSAAWSSPQRCGSAAPGVAAPHDAHTEACPCGRLSPEQRAAAHAASRRAAHLDSVRNPSIRARLVQDQARGPLPPQNVPFPKHWINGAHCASEPKIQVWRYDADTWILRQSMCTNFEGPFIYLLFGGSKVLMEDSGASAAGLPLASTVYGIINQWLAENQQASIQLVVCHSHGHGDHVAHDNQFIGQPNTVVVGTSQAAVKAFFNIPTWPTDIVAYDLGGGRIIDVIPIPGHQTAHIALYDRRNDLLLTGDTLYPGRLYFPASQFATYKQSVQRMVNFAAANPVRWVLGTHIEMSTTPGDDFPIGSTYHPNEHALQLTHDHLLELHTALQAMPAPVNQVHDDFIIYPL